MTNSSDFQIDSDSDGRATRVLLRGELDIATVPRVEEAVEEVRAQGSDTIVLDLSALSFMDSSGLRLLIVVRNRARTEGWTLGLVRPSGQVLSLLRITGAEQNLPFVEDPAGD